MSARAGAVAALLSQVTGTPVDRIGPGFDLQQVAGWSSLRQLMLVSQLESRFGVAFDNADLAQLGTFDGIMGRLDRRLGAAA